MSGRAGSRIGAANPLTGCSILTATKGPREAEDGLGRPPRARCQQLVASPRGRLVEVQRDLELANNQQAAACGTPAFVAKPLPGR